MSAVGNTLRSIVSVFPSVVKPVRKKSLNERLIWTVGALLLYLVMSQIPLYGVASGMEDQMSYTSIIFATAQGTLVHLGIGPIVTAGLVLQLLKGADIIPLNFKDPADRALFSSSTKVLALFITFVEGIAFMIGGQFGTGLSGTTQVIIIAQLVLAGFVILLLDELVQKADMAMYVSKTQGKDKFTLYNDEINEKMLEKLNLEKIRKIMEVNFFGTINSINAVYDFFREKKSGHISIVSSVAGYRGLPAGGGYCASKAALNNYAESLYFDMKRFNVRVSLVCLSLIHI